MQQQGHGRAERTRRAGHVTKGDHDVTELGGTGPRGPRIEAPQSAAAATQRRVARFPRVTLETRAGPGRSLSRGAGGPGGPGRRRRAPPGEPGSLAVIAREGSRVLFLFEKKASVDACPARFIGPGPGGRRPPRRPGPGGRVGVPGGGGAAGPEGLLGGGEPRLAVLPPAPGLQPARAPRAGPWRTSTLLSYIPRGSSSRWTYVTAWRSDN